MKKADDTKHVAHEHKKVEELTSEVDVWKNKYLRSLADYQNLERRVEEQQKELRDNLEKDLIYRLIPIIDVFDELAKHEQYKKDLGLHSVRIQIHDVLRGYGVTHRPVIGTLFDPHIMECIEARKVEDVTDDNKVLEEPVKAYFLRNKLIRPAKVIVGKKN